MSSPGWQIRKSNSLRLLYLPLGTTAPLHPSEGAHIALHLLLISGSVLLISGWLWSSTGDMYHK